MSFLSFQKLVENNLLLEKTRQELLKKQKQETPERVIRAQKYSVSQITIDSDAFMYDWLVIKTNISGNNKTYEDIIAFKGVVTDLISSVKNSSNYVVNSKSIIRSIHKSLDNQDIYIDCTCPDFKYRYAYFATQDKFKWGKLQNSNGKQIRNPNNDIGCMCKHLYALLRSNKFLDAISDKIMRIIMANLDILVRRFNIDILEFRVNSAAYDKMLKMNITRDKEGKFRKTTEEPQDDKQANDSNDNNSNTNKEGENNDNNKET